MKIVDAFRCACIALFVVCACPVVAQDTEPPQVASVVVTPSLVAAGDDVSVTVVATDNTGVVQVSANGTALANTNGDTWSGVIIAESAIGSHSVTVVARDAADNSATDASKSYKTGPVYGIQNDKALEPAVRNTTAASDNLYRVWGAAHVVSPDIFSVNDGGLYSTNVLAAGHDVCNGDFVIARGVLNPAAPPATLSNPQYIIAAPVARTPINIGDLTLGKDLMGSLNGTLVSPAPAGNLKVRITSQDSAKVLVSNSPTEAGQEMIFVQVNAGSTSVPDFYVHCLASSGTATLLATAPGCQGKTITITCRPSGFVINYPSAINTTTFSANYMVQVVSARLNPVTLAWAGNQPVRPGVNPQVGLVSSNPGVGTIVGSPTTFSGGDQSKSIAFDPQGAGQTTVSIVQPAGFTTPADYQSITATVTTPNIGMSTDITVGKDLQASVSISLESVPPAPVDVKVTSADPAKVILSKSATVAGSGSVTFTGVNSTYVGSYYVQGLDLGSNVQLTVSAPGYNTKHSNVTINPSGFVISYPGAIATTSFSANYIVQINAGLLNPVTLVWAGNQPIRPGVSAQVGLVSSNPGVGTIVGSPVTFSGGDQSKIIAFDPQGAGQTTVSIVQPGGFTTPADYQSITATVTAPNISMSTDISLGKDLQTSASISLESAPPAPWDVTVTSADPAKVTLSKSATVAGSGSITFTGVNSPYVGVLYVQGVDLGTNVQLTVSAPGYNTKQAAVTISPSGFIINWPSAINTKTFSTNSLVEITPARLNPITLAWEGNQPVRPGVSAQVGLLSSNPGVGTIAGSPVTFSGGDQSKGMYFDPQGTGQAAISIVPPAGFSIPADYQGITATVTTPNIGMSTDITVGRDLQASVSVSLDSAPPAPWDVTFTSADPLKVTLSKNPTVAGSGSVTFTGVNSPYVGVLYVQGIDLGTNVPLTASASGYNTKQAVVTINPSGFIVNWPGAVNTTASAANSTVQITSALLNPVTLNWETNMPLRAGLSIGVDVLSSNPGVGTIVGSPVTFSGGDQSKNIYFDPLAAGVSIISVVQPSGFSDPSNYTQITATVNP